MKDFPPHYHSAVNGTRAILIGLLLFDLLNYFEILHFTVDFNWIGLVVTALITIAAFEFLHLSLERTGSRLSFLSMFWILFMPLIDVTADVNHWFSSFPPDYPVDRVLHFLGGIGTTSIAADWSKKYLFKRGLVTKETLTFLIAFQFSVIAAVTYELQESFDGRLGDGNDTVDDLQLQILGSVLVWLWLYYKYLGRRPLTFLQRMKARLLGK